MKTTIALIATIAMFACGGKSTQEDTAKKEKCGDLDYEQNSLLVERDRLSEPRDRAEAEILAATDPEDIAEASARSLAITTKRIVLGDQIIAIQDELKEMGCEGWE